MKEKNKKLIIIIVIIAILIIGVISFFIFVPKSNNEESFGLSEFYERLKTEQTYSFLATCDAENKSFFAKQPNKAYLDDVVNGIETEMLIQNGNTYLIKDDDKAYYTYKNNETNINKIEKILEELRELEFEKGIETIENKTYSYVEYNQLTDFVIFNTQNIKSLDIKKTRFYFEGKDLVYIKSIAGNKQELLKITFSKDVNNKLFEIPSDYAEK